MAGKEPTNQRPRLALPRTALKNNISKRDIFFFRVVILLVLLTVATFDGIVQTQLLQDNRYLMEDFFGLAKPPIQHFCLPWSNNSDSWWTHAPDWEMGMENDTHYCFDRIQNEEKRKALLELYLIQFHGNCSNVLTKRMWSSGWNADFQNVRDGLRHAVLRKRPVQIANVPWHYADPAKAKPGKVAYRTIRPVCPQGNMFCFFLPISNCPAGEGDPRDMLEEVHEGTREYQWHYEFATRRQTWLRKAIYDFRKKQTVTQGCTAMHVRRGDVVLHPGAHKRKYFPIRDYLNSSYHVQKNIFLMTDDQNAIDEAKTEFPEYNWQYIDRKRFRAAEGGFEMQLPSLDPLQEVIILLTEFELARRCQQLVHSYSTFATQVWSEIMYGGNHKNGSRIQIDVGTQVFSEDNHVTHNVSKSYGDKGINGPSIGFQNLPSSSQKSRPATLWGASHEGLNNDVIQRVGALSMQEQRPSAST